MDNYFNLLEIELSYNISMEKLDRQYLAMQSKYHPDKAKNVEEKQKNLSISINLNKAYTTLKDPLGRAEYLLVLNNIQLNDESVRQRLTDKELTSIWEDFETIENTQKLDILQQLYKQKLVYQEKEFIALSRAFQNQDIENALEITLRLKYLKTIIDNLYLRIKAWKQ